MVPGTEYIADREACNFCEEFELLGRGPDKTGDLGKAAKKLFGDKDEESPPKGFNNLFKD